MPTGFLPHKEITNPKDLFGREQLLAQLTTLANNRNTVSLVGLRRFGKTTVLKCLEYSLRKDSLSKVYPLYFDFKEVGSIIRGTDNVYRYMIAMLVERLYIDKHFTTPEIFRKKKITPSEDWNDVYEDLQDVNAVRIQSLFEELVFFFAEYLSKTILFFFDEYEHLFRFSFDDPQGFMKLRNISSKLVADNIIPFSFFVSGAITWEHLCTITGSGELNCIDHSSYIGSIGIDDFNRMWTEESNKIENCPNPIINGSDFSFQSSGGIPFYGKIIGSHWVIRNERPKYSILQSYFDELLNSLNIEQRSILLKLTEGPKKFSPSKHVLELVDKGLVKKNGTDYLISIAFLKEYILSTDVEEKNHNNFKPKTEEIVDTISNLIITINNTHKSKRGNYIFEPVNDDMALMADLRTPCSSGNMFSDFANSLYKVVFEKTKENVRGRDVVLHRLPNPYKRGHQFIDLVDIMRHSLGGGHLMDKFTPRRNQMTKEQMLVILTNSRNEPNTANDFLALQIAALSRFEVELTNLNSIVRSLT